MSKQIKFKLAGLVFAAASATLLTAPVSASIQYNFSGIGSNTSNISPVGDSSPTVNVTGWSSASTSGDGGPISSDAIYAWSGGLGVGSGNPEHATDNNGAYDSIMFDFSSSIELTGLSIGWTYKRWENGTFVDDTDMTVLAYTGANFDVDANLKGKTYQELVAPGGGWEVIDHLANVAVDSNPSSVGDTIGSINSDGTSSSIWLVGAYNPLVGNPDGWTDPGNLGTGWKDYFKLSAVYGQETNIGGIGNSVPEPSTLPLLGLGLLAFWYYRRREQGNALAH